MEMSLPKLHEAKHVVTYSKQGRQHTDVGPVAPTILACSVVDAMIHQIILGIWFISVYRWATVDAVTAETQKHGGCLSTVLSILHTKMVHG
jgi:hypothetical protein